MIPRVFERRENPFPAIHLCANLSGTITNYEDVRDAALHLPKADQARLLSVVAHEVADAYPGIEFQPAVVVESPVRLSLNPNPNTTTQPYRH